MKTLNKASLWDVAGKGLVNGRSPRMETGNESGCETLDLLREVMNGGSVCSVPNDRAIPRRRLTDGQKHWKYTEHRPAGPYEAVGRFAHSLLHFQEGIREFPHPRDGQGRQTDRRRK
ncbi:hypothetical protein Q8A67_019062 [Cirrhinus molitorella]|uniref:Uncharacterized protein n=1 Tax=Cirrhinus molitorella TaxID=172907 RepID=A0AA88PBN4_9TELE|nr:hypothetical protein Q8A67_019062 [Cirrhinus molitorella]